MYISQVKETLENIELNEWSTLISLLESTWITNKVVFTCGNGGSASIAAHFVTDWNKGLSENLGRQVKAVNLNSNISLLTAIANDFSYDEVFSKQISYLGKSGDLLLAISGSGNSKNTLVAVETAKSLGLRVASLTGFAGGKLKPMSDFNLNVNSNNMQVIEDVFSVFGHAVYSTLSSKL